MNIVILCKFKPRLYRRLEHINLKMVSKRRIVKQENLYSRFGARKVRWCQGGGGGGRAWSQGTSGVKYYDCNWLPRETFACSHWDQGLVVRLMRGISPGCQEQFWDKYFPSPHDVANDKVPRNKPSVVPSGRRLMYAWLTRVRIVRLVTICHVRKLCAPSVSDMTSWQTKHGYFGPRDEYRVIIYSLAWMMKAWEAYCQALVLSRFKKSCRLLF